MATKVALAGSTGKIGPAILKALLDANFEVVILSRKGSNSTDSLPKHDHQIIIKVDYADVADLTSALRGVEAVVSTLSSKALDTQKPLIDASVAAGVKRFIPSEFSMDLDNDLNRAMPAYPGKIKTQKYIGDVAAANPNFTYSNIYNNIWLDWGIKAGIILDPTAHKATLWDGGDHPVSATRLSTVGTAVVSVIKHQEATKNRAVYIHDFAISLKDLVEVARKINGAKWTTVVKSTADNEKSGHEELKKPEPNMAKATLAFQLKAAFGKDNGCDFSDKVDNKLLGIPELKGEEITEAVKESLLGERDPNFLLFQDLLPS